MILGTRLVFGVPAAFRRPAMPLPGILNRTMFFTVLNCSLLPLVTYCDPAGCKYDVTATISQTRSEVHAATWLTYRNRGPEALSSLIFHFRGAEKDFSVIDKSKRPLQIGPFVDAIGEAKKHYFVIRLADPLKAGDSTRLWINSETTILDRYGIKHLEGCWHPKVVARTEGQWQTIADDFADYRVTVGPIAQALIPASGRLIQRRRDEDGLWTLTFEASNIPNFGIVLSHCDHVVSQSDDDVVINCFYLSDRDVAERMLDVAADVVRFYRNMYGFYPDTLLNIIAFDGTGFGGGPIGSNIVHVNKTFHQDQDSTIWAIAHEIAHEYWGSNWLVGPKQQVAWLCLGMGLWSDLQYMQAHKKTGLNSNMLDDYFDALKKGLNTRLEELAAEDMQNRMDENPLAHSKGHAIALMLEYLLGKDTFHRIAKTTLDRCAHRLLTTPQFQHICEEISGQELGWFFQQWVFSNDTLDYAIADVKSTDVNSKQQITVTTKAQGHALMPVDVLLESADGVRTCRRLARGQNLCTFVSDKAWRRIILDPNNHLPDTNRADNIRMNLRLESAFEILEVDPGDKAWGLNLLKVNVKNTTNQERPLVVHIGGKVPNACRFGRGDYYVIGANDCQCIEHWYWIPPGHGSFNMTVSFKEPVSPSPPWKVEPFLVRTYPVNFSLPNDKCNNLTITEKLPFARKYFPDVRHLDPFECFTTEHFVFYCSPNTPAHKDIKTLMAEHESALKKVCDFAGVTPAEPIVVFFYPDRMTKRMCTMHTGDGLARGNMVAQVYNDRVKLDAHHELTHVVMGELGNPPALFREGLAVYMQAGHLWNGQHVDESAANLLRNRQLTPLSKLISRTEIGSQDDDGRIAYPASASFVKFLIGKYGTERFGKAYQKLESGSSSDELNRNISYLNEVFGRSLAELESRWHDTLTGFDKGRRSGDSGTGRSLHGYDLDGIVSYNVEQRQDKLENVGVF